MNKSQFQQLKQYLGADLLNFSLNREDITYHSDYDAIEFNEDQISVLADMHAKIQQCRLQYVVQGGSGDGADFYLRRLEHEGNSIFNRYRACCGAVEEDLISDDPVIAHLQKLCVRDYPNLLMKSTGSHNMPLMGGMNVGMADYDTFITLVKNDPLNDITNGKDGLEYCFQFSTEDGLQFNTQVCTACTILITRAFYDDCNRMDYSLLAVLKTIADYINTLRELAKGNEVDYSSFVGIRGVRFIGFKELTVPGANLRQYTGIENPGLHTQRTIVSHSDDHGKYSGHVLEIIHKTKVMSHEATCNTGNSEKSNKAQQNVLDKMLFSLVFSCECTKGPVPSFFEIAFPLISPGNCGFSEKRPGEYLLVDEARAGGVREWFDVLRERPLEKVKTPLQRLKYAIFERHNPEDAIVDAVIAWEGMFSEAFETTFKVTGSMAKFLCDIDERPMFLSRLKKLYNLRSELVHGSESKLLKNEGVDELRSEVINIGLRCLKQLVSDEVLLPMSPSERVHHLLIFDDSTQPGH